MESISRLTRRFALPIVLAFGGAVAEVQPASEYLYLRGANTQGGGGSQHDPARVPGKLDTDYHYNSQGFYGYIASRGHKVVRLDFLWERLQPELGGPLDAEKLGELKAAVNRVKAAGMFVLLDMKNYGGFWRADDTKLVLGAGISAEQFADAWNKIAEEFKDEPAVFAYGLMNEPHDLPEGIWKTFSQAAVSAIRATGDTRTILVAGDDWSGAWNWAGANGVPWIEDPADNIVYEAHLYFDHDRSGRYENKTYSGEETKDRAGGWPSLSARVSADLANFTGWLKKHNQRGFIGEVGWPSGPDAEQWNAVGRAVYSAGNDAQIGITYWATGEWLSSGGGMYNQDAYNQGHQQPQAQTEVIEAEANRSRFR